jgi:hypothetical protein
MRAPRQLSSNWPPLSTLQLILSRGQLYSTAVSTGHIQRFKYWLCVRSAWAPKPFIKSLNNNKQLKKLLFLGILLTFSVFIIFMIFQLILPVLLTPTNYCFQDQVTSPSDRLLLVNQTLTKLDMVYSDSLWSPPDMVLVLILDSRKYDHHQIYL